MVKLWNIRHHTNYFFLDNFSHHHYLSLSLTYTHLSLTPHPDSHHILDAIDIRQLLPTLDHYVTYEGSLTEPPCHETVQWIVLNKPIYVTDEQLSIIRNSINIDGDNFRPLQATNYRCVRTNIMRNFNKTFDEVSLLDTNYERVYRCVYGECLLY